MKAKIARWSTPYGWFWWVQFRDGHLCSYSTFAAALADLQQNWAMKDH